VTPEAMADLAALQFMGKVVAAFSHDFKNALAIINENAGLLKDLIAMAAGGRPLDPARLETLAGRIGQQVRRADEMSKQVNRFAHSMDKPAEEVDLPEMLALAAALSHRPAALQRVALEVAAVNAPLRLTVFVFGMQRLLYDCLQAAIAACGSGGRVILSAAGTDRALTVAMTPVDAVKGDITVPETAAALAAGLGARLESGPGCLGVVWDRA